MNPRVFSMLAVIVMVQAGNALAFDQPYDPLAVSGQNIPKTLDITVDDPARQRDIPVRIYLPSGKAAAPVVLFSHGLGGSREGYAYLGRHWAERGYVAVFLQHRGSDTSVWKDKPAGERMAAMKRAASLKNFMLRVGDVPSRSCWINFDAGTALQVMHSPDVSICRVWACRVIHSALLPPRPSADSVSYTDKHLLRTSGLRRP